MTGSSTEDYDLAPQKLREKKLSSSWSGSLFENRDDDFCRLALFGVEHNFFKYYIHNERITDKSTWKPNF